MSDLETQVDKLSLLRSFSGFDEPVRFSGTGGLKQIVTNPNGQQLVVSAAAFYLLKAIRNGNTVDEIHERHLESGARLDRYSLDRACRKALDEFNRLARDRVSDDLPWGFWARFRLVPESAVKGIAAWCESMFSIPLIAVCVIVCVLGAFGTQHFLQVHQSGDTNIVTLYLLFLASLVCHEFGHATACSFFQCRAREIGFTIYLIYPAFYCDVTAAWALSKWRRVVIDLAGCYFQATVGGIFSIIWLITHEKIFGTASVAIFYSICFSLSPIFRTDGYWILADILGVKRLDRSFLETLRELLRKFNGHSRSVDEPVGICLIVTFYSLLTTFVWIRFSLHVLPYLILSSRSVVHQLLLITSSLQTMHRPSLHTDIAFISSAFIMLLAYFGAIRLAMTLVSKLRALMRSIMQKIRAPKGSNRTAQVTLYGEQRR